MGPVAVVGTLLGVTSAMLIVGMSSGFTALFTEGTTRPTPAPSIVIGAVLLALATGVRLPHRFAVWVCALAWQRFVRRGRPSGLTRALLGTFDVDRPLYWIVLSVVSLTSGILVALWPFSLNLAETFYRWTHLHFVWSVGPLALLQAMLVFATGLIPLALLGLTMSCVHHLSCPFGRWDTRATAWLLIGSAGGALATTWMSSNGTRINLATMVAAVPVLLVAVLAAGASSPRAKADTSTAPDPSPQLPIWPDRWPRLLRVSIVAVGGCGACFLAIWVGELMTTNAPIPVALATMLLALGLGVLAGCRPRRSGPQSIGSFGLSCASAGLMLAIAGIALRRSAAPMQHQWTTLAGVGTFALGYAIGAGRQTLLNRVASRSSTGTVMFARLLVCAALASSVAAPVMKRSLGIAATFTTMALFLLVLGGTLIVHESTYSARSRWIRLAVVFGSVGAMMAWR